MARRQNLSEFCGTKKYIMETQRKKFPTPPWDMEIAAERLGFEEAAWNSHDPEKIVEGYTDNIEMRDGVNFIKGRDELRLFLQRKFQQQLDYTLKLDLWGALKGRMAVRFEAEWHDTSGQWYRSYGVQVFQFNEEGYAEGRHASQETVSINSRTRLPE
jgi:nuclear transport factor 2 (NTF2) superfamily protein